MLPVSWDTIRLFLHVLARSADRAERPGRLFLGVLLAG